MLTAALWSLVAFVLLVAITAVMCLFYKRHEENNYIRVATFILLILCFAFVGGSVVAWPYFLLSQWIGYGWAAAVSILFWLVPPPGGRPMMAYSFSSLLIDEVVNFDRVVLTGWGCMRDGNVIWGNDKEARAAIRDFVNHTKPQIREQVKNPFTRWWLMHYRWYAPSGGYFFGGKDLADAVDEWLHNDCGFPISRFVTIRQVGFKITEVNF